LTDYRKKLLQHKELDARVKTRKYWWQFMLHEECISDDGCVDCHRLAH
jgi:hypothetical protein